MDKNQNILKRTEHSCSTTKNDVEIKKIKEIIKKKIFDTNELFSRIYTEATSKLDIDTLSKLPKFEDLRDVATKKRNIRDSYTLGIDHDIPPKLQETMDGKNFLFIDTGKNDLQRIIIFFHEDFRIYIKKIDTWIIDGTFKSCPSDFYQMVTLQGIFFGKYIPFIFILLSEKTQFIYEKAFEILKEKNILFPKHIICDFEIALANACKTFNNLIEIYGCNFHFSQAIYRKVQNLGLSNLYKNNKTFNDIIQMYLNLSFINPTRLQEAYKYLIKKIEEENLLTTLKDFIEYFETTYLGKCNNDPLYPVGFWSVYLRVTRNLPRTTNSLEGWHRGFNQMVNVKHPNLGKFVDCLRIETEKNRAKIAKYCLGNYNPKLQLIAKDNYLNILLTNESFILIENLFMLLKKNINWKYDN